MGNNLNLAEIFPKVSLPVSRGTPMINHLIRYKSRTWEKTIFFNKSTHFNGERETTFTINETRWAFLTGHVIDGTFG